MTDPSPTKRNKKASNGAGTVERRGDLWWVQVSLPKQPGEPRARRPRVPIAGSEKMTEAQAKRAGARTAADVRSHKIVFDPKPRKGALPSPAAVMTVRQVGEAWTSGELYKQYGAVDGLSPRKSAYIDGKTLAKHVYGVKTRGATGPDFGDLPIASVTSDDARAVMGAQRPEEQALQTRRHTYNRARQLFKFAELPLKLRHEDSNPFTERMRPRKVKGVDVERNFQYLFPSESVRYSGHTNARLARRVLVAVAAASGFDVSTITGTKDGTGELTWWHYDVRNRVLQGVRPKVGKVAYAEGEPAWLFDLLDAWRELSGAPAADAPAEALKAAPIFPLAMLGWRRGREAEELRADFLEAGITRRDLHEETKTNKRFRWHDLRATFETWARRAGWTQERIDRRTCHGSRAMGDRYDRAASTLAELQEVPFPNLAMATPETRAVLEARLHTRLHTRGRPADASEAPEAPQPSGITGCEGGDLNPYALSGASTSSGTGAYDEAESSGNTSVGSNAQASTSPLAGPVCNDLCNAIDADEELLESKMLAADIAGNDTLVTAYRRRLERLRAEKVAGNVTSITAAKRHR